jgi:uncharacterized protein
MTKGTTPVSLGDIQKVVQQIVDHCHPQKVILFGSYAHGTPTEDSDVDLLVESPLHAAARIAAVVDHPCALDILVRSPSDLEASLARKGVFATEVLRTGMVLYEA